MKCPKCNSKGSMIKVRMSPTEVKEFFYCSSCFYDESKEEIKKKVNNKKSKDIFVGDIPFFECLEIMSQDMKEMKEEEKSDVIKRFEKLLNDFLDEEMR